MPFKLSKVIIPLLGMLFILASCSQEERVKEEVIRPVKAQKALAPEDQSRREYPAVTQEPREVALAFRTSGPLIQLNGEEGQYIPKGKLIGEIDPRDFKVDLQAREARLIQTGTEEERYRKLYEKRSINKSEYDKRLAEYLEAKSAFEAAENALSDTRLFAPFGAYVGRKLVENYEDVQAKQPVITLIDLSKIEVKFYVAEQAAVRADEFDYFTVRFETYPDKVFRARLKEIGKKAEPEGFPITLYLEIPRGEKVLIRPGFTCNARIYFKTAGDAQASKVVVPITAVFESGNENEPSVWVLDEESMTVSKRKVAVGNFVSNKSIEVTSGLEDGEWVVTAGVQRINEGQQVKFLLEKF
jgi:RND family efflux transporter MFP subunit